MSELRHSLQAANLVWRDNGTPASAEFDDIYFSTVDGAAECQYVFLQQNRLQQRWQQTLPSFTVAETGFGSGLNFLLTRQLWERTQPRSSRLHYISVEKHPMRRSDLRRTLQRFPAVQKLADELLAQYPPLLTGQHLLHFRWHSITLHLLFGDAAQMLGQLLPAGSNGLAPPPEARVDAWYLDGFAPRCNAAMWSAELCAIISRLSGAGTSLSTFSAAASVKKNLQTAGFSVNKVPGFGNKRDMLTASWQRYPVGQPDRKRRSMYDFPRALWYVNTEAPRAPTATVIGGGIAGCCAASSLARRGFKVQLLEQRGELADAASGNRQVALYTRLSPFASPANDFALAAYLYALRYYQPYFSGCGRQCGLLQLIATRREEAAYAELLRQCDDKTLLHHCDSQAAAAIAGVPVAHNAVYFPKAGWLQPQALCARLIDHPGISVSSNVTVRSLQADAGLWHMDYIGNEQLRATANVIVAMGQQSKSLAETSFLPIKAIRGQVSYLPSKPASAGLRCIICDRSFIMPAVDGSHTIGASYNLSATSHELSQQDHCDNMRQVSALLSNALPADAPLSGRVGFRGVTPDYLPIVGPVPQANAFQRDYAALAQDAKLPLDKPSRHIPGLYLSSAYGSRGYCFAPLCAELLASQMSGEPAPLPAYIVRALLPGRFLIRNIIRGS